jgi:hypothetical protein
MKRTIAKFELRRTTLQSLTSVTGGRWQTNYCNNNHGSYDDGCSNTCDTCNDARVCYSSNECSPDWTIADCAE